MSSLERAIALAARAHEGQLDKAGAPYILHPLRVMMAVHGATERIVAVLHDVLEDTTVTADELRAQGFGEDVVEAVLRLTRHEGESYEQFVQRCGAHAVARTVKLADLHDNSNLARLANPGPADVQRQARYLAAIAQLQQMTP